MSPGVLQVPDDAAFWTDRRWDAEERVREELAAAGFRGLVLDGPASVSLAEREALPLCGFYGLEGADLVAGALRGGAVLVGTCLETGQVLAGEACRSRSMKERERPALTPAQVEQLRASADVAAFGLDARFVLDLPWRPGTWSFRVVLREHVSDALRVRLEGAPAPAKPVVNVTPWPAPRPGVAVYEDVPDAPRLPSRAGFALAADRALVTGERDARWGLRLAYRLPVRPAERVQQDDGGRLKAIVPMTLVVVGTAMPGAWVVPLRVPCYDLAGDQATGQVELDLLKLGGALDAQTCFIYAAAGDAWGGPARTALVSQDALPRDRRGA